MCLIFLQLPNLCSQGLLQPPSRLVAELSTPFPRWCLSLDGSPLEEPALAQEESGTASCHRWHFQEGTARGEDSSLGTGVIPNTSCLSQTHPSTALCSQPCLGTRRPFPAWPQSGLACSHKGRAAQISDWDPVGKGNPTPCQVSWPGWTGQSQVWVWINISLSQNVCSKRKWCPRACRGNGNQHKGKDPTAAQLWT